MSTDKEKAERPKSKIGGLGNMFRTLGRAGKKDKNEKSIAPTGPVHGPIIGVAISSFSDVPPVARRCLDFLETDSVLRMESFSLTTPSLTEVQRLIKQFEDMDPEMVNLTNESPDTVCGVLRKWLRSLPEPLFMYDTYDSWIALQHNPVNEDLFSDIQNLMFQLHPTHYLVMQRIIRLLHKLSLYGSVNKLTASVLGFNWQPCLIWSQASATALDAMRVGPDGGLAGSIVTTMIENYDKLFLEDSTWSPPQFDLPGPSSSIPSLYGASNDSPSISVSNASISRSEDEDFSFSDSHVSTPTQSQPIIQGYGGIPLQQQSPPPLLSQGSRTASSGSIQHHASSSPSSSGSFMMSSSGYNAGNGSSGHNNTNGSNSPTAGVSHPSAVYPPSASGPNSTHSSSTTPVSFPAPSGGYGNQASGAGTLPPLSIPPYSAHSSSGSTSMPITPITPLVTPNPGSSLTRSFASPPAVRANSTTQRDDPSSTSSTPRHSSISTPTTAKRKLPVLVNGYTQATSICDFTDMTDGMLQFFKNEHIYVTHKHEDGWWEGWKRGRRGFFPALFVTEIYI